MRFIRGTHSSPAVFTYIKPYLTGVCGLSTATVTWVLLLFGAGMTIGNIIGGRFADWKLMPTVVPTLLAVALLFAATLNQGAFNVGNVGGAWIGGLAISWGVSYANLPLVGATLALLAVAVAVLSQSLDRRAVVQT
ncbi:Major facilitator superfamily MFS_1 (fragment) [Mesorhizobium sp. SOD10]